MDSIKFQNDILKVLKKYGYKTSEIQKLEILINSPEDLPKINLEYLEIGDK